MVCSVGYFEDCAVAAAGEEVAVVAAVAAVAAAVAFAAGLPGALDAPKGEANAGVSVEQPVDCAVADSMENSRGAVDGDAALLAAAAPRPGCPGACLKTNHFHFHRELSTKIFPDRSLA